MEARQDPEILTIGEAARRLRISPKTLRAWCDQGLVEYYRLPSGYRRFTAQQIRHTDLTMQRPARGHLASNSVSPSDQSSATYADVPPLVARFDALRAQFAVGEFNGSTADLINEAREERPESQ